MYFEADNDNEIIGSSTPAMLHRDACMFALRPCICYHPHNTRAKSVTKFSTMSSEQDAQGIHRLYKLYNSRMVLQHEQRQLIPSASGVVHQCIARQDTLMML